ncbi:PBECR4 domain-containing protein [Paenibacillus sp. LHD-117]|uniref:PBECR4 domain-containing protein n=1 Tax=Paenibacillus sp. LHD-117 TaxID=3071412 RepID=UPI0027DFF41D|nr:PBECR4 domain-containing protein [Paenibacillus sp. LHD-117]MDQ6422605.1 PBECR4 domain-containing protein [Paenibacillus sp. LHD-117]
MVLTVKALAALTEKPNIDQISLELLRQFYEEHLEPFTFVFEFEDGQKISLDFKKEEFCHLVGIQKLAVSFVALKDRYKYFGAEGYKNIQNGTITLRSLRDQTKNNFSLIKDKLVFFYLLPSIVNSPKIMLDFVAAPQGSRIQCKLLAYNSTADVYVHLGIDENKATGRHFPRTFFTERVNQNSDGTKFLKGQKPLNVVNTVVIDRRKPTPPAMEPVT